MHIILKNKIINKYNILVILIGAFSFASVPIYAADWTSIKKSTEYELWVDMDSYNEPDGLPYITAKTVYKKPKNATVQGKKIKLLEMRVRNQFDCKKQTYKMLETHFYDVKNKLIASENGVKSFEQIKRSSDDAVIASLTCQVYKMVGGT